MSAPISLAIPAASASPAVNIAPGAPIANAAAGEAFDVAAGADQPFAVVLREFVKTLGMSADARLPDARIASQEPGLEAFQAAQDPATIAAAVATMATAALGITAVTNSGAPDQATPAVSTDIAQPATADLATLLAQLVPVSRHPIVASHAGTRGEVKTALSEQKQDDMATAQAAAGTLLDPSTNAGTDTSIAALNAQVLATPVTAGVQTERPQETKSTSANPEKRLLAVKFSTSAAADASLRASLTAAASAEPKSATANPANALIARETPNAAAIVAAPALASALLAGQETTSSDRSASFETILAHAQGGNLVSAEAAAQASAHAASTTNLAAATNTAATALVVNTPLGSAGWTTDIGDKILWMVGRQEQRVELVLNPPQLGRVEVSLSLNGDQATAQFLSANPVVREALESAMPRLREMLADGGITLGQTHVGSDSSGQAANQRENGDNRPSFSSGDSMLETPVRAGGVAPQWFERGRGLVDVFA